MTRALPAYLRLFARRFLTLCAVVWAAGTINFFIPKIAPKNPIAEKLTQLAGTSGVDPSKIQEMASIGRSGSNISAISAISSRSISAVPSRSTRRASPT